MPCSSPRSSGWRATAWIIEPKMLPMPTPAPRAPRPMPSASAMALPASTVPFAAARGGIIDAFLLVFGLDGRADVDGGQGGEDEGLDRDHDDDLEQVERSRGRNAKHRNAHVLEHEDEADEGQDQHVARQHVRVQADGE